MGRKLILTGTKLTDNTAPKLISVDPLESAGSLLLIDPTHPAGTWAAGVPTSGTLVPNLLADTARAVTGTAVPGLTFTAGSGWNGTKGKLERTGKGGLHGIVSPTLATMDTTMRLLYNTDIKAHILSNPTHDFYFSSWHRTTRVSANAAQKIFHIVGNSTQSGANFLFYLRADTLQPGGYPKRQGANTIGPRIDTMAVNQWTGTVPTTPETGTPNAVSAYLTPAGSQGFAYTDAMVGGTGAAVFYRHYVEDLTVSGRTYAEVDAIDNDLYTREVLNPGGRYYGDTFTDPATIA